MPKVEKHVWFAVLALAALVTVLAPAAQAAERTLRVEMSEPFEVAGVLYPPGVLSLREVNDFTPVAHMTEIRVNAQSLGVMLARNASPFRSTRDEIIFHRADDGHLVLAAVALKGQPARNLHRHAAADDGWQWLAAIESQSPLLVASTR